DLVNESKKIYLTEKLVKFELTREEWEEYLTLTLSYKTGEGTHSLSSRLGEGRGEDLSPFENFYREAEIRDQRMAENLSRAMDQTHAKVAVLITGGFHADGISSSFRPSSRTASSPADPGSSSAQIYKLKNLGPGLRRGDETTVVSFVPRLTKLE